jgi:hypothetical protein
LKQVSGVSVGLFHHFFLASFSRRSMPACNPSLSLVIPPAVGGKRPTNAEVAAATAAHVVAKVAGGQALTDADKATLARRLNMMTRG